MAQCIHCGAESLLFGNDKPICPKCFDERKALEQLWHKRLLGAKLRLESAQYSLHKLLNDSAVDRFSTVDGRFAYRQAIKEETLALRAFARVRRTYDNLTVYGIIPDDDESSKE